MYVLTDNCWPHLSVWHHDVPRVPPVDDSRVGAHGRHPPLYLLPNIHLLALLERLEDTEQTHTFSPRKAGKFHICGSRSRGGEIRNTLNMQTLPTFPYARVLGLKLY